MPDAAILTAMGTLLAAVGSLFAVLHGTRKSRAEADQIRAQTRKILAEVQPNHGSSMADKVDQIQTRVIELAQSVGRIRNDMRGIRDDMGADRRDLADLRVSADETHRRMDRVIDRLATRTAADPSSKDP